MAYIPQFSLLPLYYCFLLTVLLYYILIHELRIKLERLHRGLVHPVLMAFQYHSIHTVFLRNVHHFCQVHIAVSKLHTVRLQDLSSGSAHPCSTVVDMVKLHSLSQALHERNRIHAYLCCPARIEFEVDIFRICFFNQHIVGTFSRSHFAEFTVVIVI